LIEHLRNYAVLLVTAAIVIGLDQWTKALVRANLALEEFWAPWDWLEPYARIVHWKNTGAAFGMLQGFGDVFTILAIIVALAILYYFPQVPRGDWPLRLAMGLQFGGALGNLIDRIAIGWVTDFISIGSFPVFNIADASISTGVAVLVLGVWIKEKRQDSSGNPPADEEVVSKTISEESWGE
jgi:signal peptidase II